MNEFNNQMVSLIRTVVPVIVGQLITWLAAAGIIDQTGQISAALLSLLTVILTAAYYAIVRVLEAKVSDKFGWLLGVPKAPTYPEAK